MTLDEFSFSMKAKQALLKDPALRERLALVAANAVTVLVKRRVFRDGIAQDGSLIGKYSTKPAYFGIKTPGVPKLAAKGKTPRAKSSYYAKGGYAEYRQAVGRQSAKVDLNLSGATFLGVGAGVNGSGLPAFGIKTKEAQERIEGNELRFDCVTVTPNEAERQAGRDAATQEIKFILGIT